MNARQQMRNIVPGLDGRPLSLGHVISVVDSSRRFATMFGTAAVLLTSFATTTAHAISTTPKVNTEQVISVSAVGDLMLGTDYPRNQLPPMDGARILSQAKAYIQDSDIRFGNFEGTLHDGPPGAGAKAIGRNRYAFRTPTRYASLLTQAGFNVMSLANNHIRDMGRAGVISTKQTLQEAGIQYSSKDGEVAQFDIRGTRVALIATDYYTGPRSITQPDSTYREIEELSRTHPIVIVSVHAGGEGAKADRVVFGNEIFLGENRGNSVAFAREAIRRGADLIIMHGPHIPRGLEVFEDRLIVYSLGNFATMQGISINGVNAIAPLIRVQMKANGEFYKGHIGSFEQARPDIVRLDAQNKALKMMERLSIEQFPTSAPKFYPGGFLAPAPSASSMLKPLP